MTLPINTLSNGINNPTSTETLSIDRTFVLASNLKQLIFLNTSTSEPVNILIKGTRPTTSLPQYGDIDISGGDPFTLSPLAVCTLAVQLMYKHFGENGDTITISSTSTDKSKVVCWLSE